MHYIRFLISAPACRFPPAAAWSASHPPTEFGAAIKSPIAARWPPPVPTSRDFRGLGAFWTPGPPQRVGKRVRLWMEGMPASKNLPHGTETPALQ